MLACQNTGEEELLPTPLSLGKRGKREAKASRQPEPKEKQLDYLESEIVPAKQGSTKPNHGAFLDRIM